MTDVTSERWLPVADCNGYEVSDLSRVRSYFRNPAGHILASQRERSGYMTLFLGRGRKRYIHRLVAEAFIGPCPEGQEVRHKDGNRANNHASNLEYGTRSQNNHDKADHGTAVNQNSGKTVCDNGHEYTDETTYVYPNGERCCKICRRATQRRLRQAKRAMAA